MRSEVRQPSLFSLLSPWMVQVAGDVESGLGMKYYGLADRFQIEKQEVSILKWAGAGLTIIIQSGAGAG